MDHDISRMHVLVDEIVQKHHLTDHDAQNSPDLESEQAHDMRHLMYYALVCTSLALGKNSTKICLRLDVSG